MIAVRALVAGKLVPHSAEAEAAADAVCHSAYRRAAVRARSYARFYIVIPERDVLFARAGGQAYELHRRAEVGHAHGQSVASKRIQVYVAAAEAVEFCYCHIGRTAECQLLYPLGFLLCHFHSEAHMSSMPSSAFQPSSRSAFDASA